MMKWKTPTPALKGEINYAFIDRFTLIHFMIGIFYRIIGLTFIETLALAIFWEFIENTLKANIPEFFPHATADSWRNSLGDTLAVCFGREIIELYFYAYKTII